MTSTSKPLELVSVGVLAVGRLGGLEIVRFLHFKTTSDFLTLCYLELVHSCDRRPLRSLVSEPETSRTRQDGEPSDVRSLASFPLTLGSRMMLTSLRCTALIW